MKTWYFNHTMGWIGGAGVVTAETKEKGLEYANKLLRAEPIWNGESIEEEDLHELPGNSGIIITNGDY